MKHMGEMGIVRTLLGMPLVLFIPGYVLIATLFPKNNDLESIERIVLSVGLSLVVVSLLGLMLNYTFGIRLIPILITLCSYSIILIFIAYYRRMQQPEDLRYEVPFYKIYDRLTIDIHNQGITDKILTVILIISIIGTAGALVQIIKTKNTGEKFTEFYILGSSGKADNYQTELKVNEPVTYMIGISNHEYRAIDYTIKVALDNNVLLSKDVTINDDQTWQQNLTVIPDIKATDKKLNFWLFKDSNFVEPYRELHLRVSAT
jgi:uncharacterized membrane protein